MTAKPYARLLLAAIVTVVLSGVVVNSLIPTDSTSVQSAGETDLSSVDVFDKTESDQLTSDVRTADDDSPSNDDCVARTGAGGSNQWPLSEYDSIEQYIEAVNRAAATLETNGDRESLLVAGLLDYSKVDTGSRLKRIGRAHRMKPSDPLTKTMLYQACDAPAVTKPCDIDAIAEQLVQVDSENSLAWAIAAGRRVSKGDLDGAMEAMNRAIAAPQSNDYYAERVVMIQRALATTDFGDYAQQSGLALFHAVSPGFSPLDLLRACTGRLSEDPQWNLACLEFGKKLEHESKSMDGEHWGLVFQRDALEALGDNEGSANVQTRIEESRANGGGMSDPVFDQRFFANEAMITKYINELSSHGQRAAQVLYVEYREDWYAKNCAPSQ